MIDENPSGILVSIQEGPHQYVICVELARHGLLLNVKFYVPSRRCEIDCSRKEQHVFPLQKKYIFFYIIYQICQWYWVFCFSFHQRHHVYVAWLTPDCLDHFSVCARYIFLPPKDFADDTLETFDTDTVSRTWLNRAKFWGGRGALRGNAKFAFRYPFKLQS